MSVLNAVAEMVAGLMRLKYPQAEVTFDSIDSRRVMVNIEDDLGGSTVAVVAIDGQKITIWGTSRIGESFGPGRFDLADSGFESAVLEFMRQEA